MMSEFTPERIEKVRLSSHLIEPPAAEVIGELLDEIQRLQSRVQELEAEQRWIPISENLPDDSNRVLIRMSNHHTVIASYFFISNKWVNDCEATVLNVTHWRPLPQPPKDGSK